MNWDWQPGLACGPFVFGEPLPAASEELSIEDLGWSDDGTGWDSYAIQKDQGTVHVAEGRIVAVECWQSLRYLGIDLLGLRLAELQTLFGDKLKSGPLVGDSQGFEVDELGAAFWIEDECVASVSVNAVGG